MPLCRNLLVIMMTMQAPGAIALAAGLFIRGGPASTDVRSALGAIFDDDHVAQEALQIHERAMRLDESARFDFLARWVFAVKRNTVQKVAGTLRVPSAQTRKAMLFKGCGTRSVPTTFNN